MRFLRFAVLLIMIAATFGIGVYNDYSNKEHLRYSQDSEAQCKEVVESYYSAIEANDIEKAMTYFGFEDKQSILNLISAKNHLAQANYKLEFIEIPSNQLTDQETVVTGATIQFAVKQEPMYMITEEVVLKKKNNKWTIYEIKSIDRNVIYRSPKFILW